MAGISRSGDFRLRACAQYEAVFASEMTAVSAHANEKIADIRDGVALAEAVEHCNPDIILHLAAQSLVRRSYVGQWRRST